ncbi:hypothetical protein [Rhodanobacter sp. C01]|uniref:hypothetical protein n=1 Tax=Rhodanobacter sp. C01 TaxID=1945856 RepID=UPI0009C8C87B|nr:hypothetical protein [Rhodanobacter sp. C01]OOG51245.1 hypothetical protein B0E50_00515 [Rhodanobacter sp. C01]
MANHLNLFVPYENAGASHENQLTRALLVVLRYSPLAHAAWLRLVAPEVNLYDLSKADFATQRQHVLSPGTEVPLGDAVPGISVWLAPDAAEVTARMAPSDRQQILDGIVTYGNDLVIVIENKISWGATTDQPHQINLHGSPVEFREKVCSISWQRLLGVLADLAEHDLVSGAERLLIGDFLNFVEERFPRIGPYATLVQCGDNVFRLERRLDTVQGQVVGTEVGKGLGWRDIAGCRKIFMAWLGLSEDSADVSLRMYPADTLGQSREFYGDPKSVSAVLALRSQEWSVKPNFHWGFMAGGYAWMNTPLPVEDYCTYWMREVGSARELGRPEWESYWARLESARIVEATAKEAFDQEFTRSQRQKVSPRPGLYCEYRWPLREARRLDVNGKLVETIRTGVNQMLAALGASLV